MLCKSVKYRSVKFEKGNLIEDDDERRNYDTKPI